ncbi:MAG: cytochrome c oxidase subunit 4 [Mycobacteriales bacterium]|nr:MAG: cytochrome C oxidase subunit IV [Pseudonocardiales bacterium]
MRVETAIFGTVSAFCFVTAVVYGVWSHEPVGTVALVLSGGFCGIIGSYFGFIVRRIDARPEDRGDADISEGAGELGFFSPRSYWPFGMGLAAMVAAIGTAFWQGWLMFIGGVAVVFAIGGLLFEYYIGQNRA